jgi:hypothetical protein
LSAVPGRAVTCLTRAQTACSGLRSLPHRRPRDGLERLDDERLRLRAGVVDDRPNTWPVALFLKGQVRAT